MKPTMKPNKLPGWVRTGRGRWTDCEASIRWAPPQCDVRLHHLLWAVTTAHPVCSPHSATRARWPWSPAGCVWVRVTVGEGRGSSRARRQPAFRPTACPTSPGSPLLLLHPTPAAATPCLYRQWTSKSLASSASLPLAASPLWSPICSVSGSSTTSSSSTPSASPSATSSLGATAGRGRGQEPCSRQSGAATRVRILLAAPGSVFPSILWQQPAAERQDEAEEDGLARLLTVEERWGGYLQSWLLWSKDSVFCLLILLVDLVTAEVTDGHRKFFKHLSSSWFVINTTEDEHVTLRSNRITSHLHSAVKVLASTFVSRRLSTV